MCSLFNNDLANYFVNCIIYFLFYKEWGLKRELVKWGKHAANTWYMYETFNHF